MELIQRTEHLEKGFQTALFPLVEDSERKSWQIGKAFQVRLAEPLKVYSNSEELTNELSSKRPGQRGADIKDSSASSSD